MKNVHATRSWLRASARLLALMTPIAVVAVAQACTYDPNHVCGANEANLGNALCVCVDGSAMTANGCVACGANEVPGDGGCVCAAGFAQAAPGAPCVAVPSGLGTACSSAMPCTDTTYDVCAGAGDGGADGGGYCTKTGCASDSDCMGGYACDTRSAPSLCARPPSGQGMACMSSADCAGTAATFCDTVVSHQCLVQGCSLANNDCFVGWTCCDLSGFGVPQPICLSLQGGACP